MDLVNIIHLYVFQVVQECHENLKLDECELWIRPDIPFIGATLDGIIHCDCHGPRCVEVKCPLAVRDQVLKGVLNTGFT